MTIITTTAPTIDATGIHVPSYADVLAFLQAKYQGIYGSDVYLGNDSQDGQWLSVQAACINDANNAAVIAYNSRSPATAVGDGLSSIIKINGIKRNTSSNSTVNVLITGVVGATISNGIVKDAGGNQWNLPASVVIPVSGQITVTATCQTVGSIAAAIDAVNQIATPTFGWQSVTNPSAAAPGAPIETDAALRVRQSISTELPSLTVMDGIVGAVAAVPGVTQYAPYQNSTNETDSNGIPAHSLALVIAGGDATAIANAIASKKGPGPGTYGTTAVTVLDQYGIPEVIRFFVPTTIAVTAAVSLKALTGYTTMIGTAIQSAVSAYINAVALGGAPGGSVEWDSALAEAKSVVGSNTFKISALTLSGPGGVGTPDVPLLFNQNASCTPASVVLTVT